MDSSQNPVVGFVDFLSHAFFLHNTHPPSVTPIFDPRGGKCSCLGPVSGLLSWASSFCRELENNNDPVVGTDFLVAQLPPLKLPPEKHKPSY